METPKPQIVEISKIVIDKKLYPRVQVDWITAYKYSQSISAGAVLPPVTLAKRDDKFLLIDGAHRIQAQKLLKQTHIDAEIFEGLTDEEIYIEAVKRNISHGRQLSSQERTQIILTLEKWNLSQDIISEILRIPVAKLKPFIASRMMRITESQEPIALKSPMSNLAGTEISQQDYSDFESDEKSIIGRSQAQLLDNLILMVKNGWLNLADKEIASKFKELASLIQSVLKTK